MEMLPQHLSEMTFKRAENVSLSDLCQDMKMWNIAWAMDGARDLATVARQDGYDLRELAERVQQLMKMGILEVKKAETTAVSKDMIDLLIRLLSQAIGPVAEIIVENTMADLGYSLASLSGDRFGQLVDRLAREIEDDKTRRIFKERMAQH